MTHTKLGAKSDSCNNKAGCTLYPALKTFYFELLAIFELGCGGLTSQRDLAEDKICWLNTRCQIITTIKTQNIKIKYSIE